MLTSTPHLLDDIRGLFRPDEGGRVNVPLRDVTFDVADERAETAASGGPMMKLSESEWKLLYEGLCISLDFYYEREAVRHPEGIPNDNEIYRIFERIGALRDRIGTDGRKAWVRGVIPGGRADLRPVARGRVVPLPRFTDQADPSAE